MGITNFLKEIPDHVYNGLAFCVTTGASVKNRISTFGQSAITSLTTTDLWNNNLLLIITPLYERTIAQLNTLDYAVMGGTAATALAVSSYALSQLGVAAFPLVAGGTALLMMVPYYFSRYRIHKFYNERANEKLKAISTDLNTLNLGNIANKFSSINQTKTELTAPEYSHLENFLKELHDELGVFQRATLSSGANITEESLNNAKTALVQRVTEIQTKISR